MAKVGDNRFIRLDWAMKRILRDKANFEVLEGFLSELLRQDIHIDDLIESEGNQRYQDDKFNRVDLKARNDKGEIYIFEVQIARQSDFLKRILYGVSKAITEQMSMHDKYERIQKVYSVSILYFDLGEGEDYIYHGKTVFKGYHDDAPLALSDKEKEDIGFSEPTSFYPEYYLIRVNGFNKVAKTPLDEWIEYFRSGTIPDKPKGKGLAQAREKLDTLNMTREEMNAYEDYMHMLASYESDYQKNMQLSHDKGLAEGRAEGRAEGEDLKAKEIAGKMLEAGLPVKQIAAITGLPADIIKNM